jgi:hypothetical protein
MIRPFSHRSSGLDVSLLGVVVAVVSFYAARFSTSAGTAPNLIRFFETSPGREYPAVLPQDKALLLLLEPSAASTDAVASSGAAGGIWSLLLVVGLLLILAGPTLAWIKRAE